MRIAVLYDHAADAPSTAGAPDVAGVLESVHAVVATLSALGHAAFPVPAGPPFERVLTRVTTAGVGLVFNLAEGVGGRAEAEPRVAALLELAGVPFTGGGSETLALCRRKDRVNALLSTAGIPIPPWTVTQAGRVPAWDRFPAIVKPAGEDGSVGIHEWSVVENPLELGAAVARAAGDVVVQQFVGGRELNVGVVGSAVLPVAEIVFSGRQRVVSYAAKWEGGSEADRSTLPVCPAALTAAEQIRAESLARAAWAVVGGSGYGRVDLRADERGRLHVLEVNPNPDMSPGAGLARMAAAAGWDYLELVSRIVAEGVAR
jgi:D-alanine-D-alanine ligase